MSVRVRGAGRRNGSLCAGGAARDGSVDGASWLFRSKNGGGVDGEHAIANLASRSRASGKPGECRSAVALAGGRNREAITMANRLAVQRRGVGVEMAAWSVSLWGRCL